MTTTTSDARVARAQDWIKAAYAKLEQQSGFIARPAQLYLSELVAAAFIFKRPLAAEAPTGTGKTLAYLIGALAAQNSTAMKDPLVVSTATKALQQQLISNDLPKLIQTGLVNPDEVSLAKGKSNYVCLKNLLETGGQLSLAEQDPEFFIDENTATFTQAQLDAMYDAYSGGAWNGDFDTYRGSRPVSVRVVAVNSDTCNRNKCEHFDKCAYFKARKNLGTAKVVVSNHDLLLQDLVMAEEQETGVLPIADFNIVFDEGHHLPDKAVQVGSSEANLSALATSLPKFNAIKKLIKGSPELQKVLAAVNVKESDFEKEELSTKLRELIDHLHGFEVDAESSVMRFAKGVVPAATLAEIGSVLAPARKLMVSVKALLANLRDASLSAPVRLKATELVKRALDIKNVLEPACTCLADLSEPSAMAKWLYHKNDALSLHTAPLEGSEVLKRILWGQERVKCAVLVSATLRDLGGFERFSARAGLPKDTRCKALPYTFPYEESRLVVAAMKATPKLAERNLFLRELEQKLPQVVKRSEGSLILFPSWSMLKQQAPNLKKQLGDKVVKVQGEATIALLVEQHCLDIDTGEGSVLVGVASMAEGLDLPGKYCTHVVIVALPFAAPNDPVEQELSDMLGPRYFAERSLPDAMIRLTQMVGRLLRREDDRGQVTIFDRRLAHTSYGQKMLKCLPPFTKVIEKEPEAA